MKSFRLFLGGSVAAFAALSAAVPAFAAELPGAPLAQRSAFAPAAQVGTGSTDVKVVVAWMIAGVILSAIILAALYMFKRRIGAFPAHPSWVAPISIMKASDLPGDVDPHESTPPDVGAHSPGH
jgi:hypothetical protein